MAWPLSPDVCALTTTWIKPERLGNAGQPNQAMSRKTGAAAPPFCSRMQRELIGPQAPELVAVAASTHADHVSGRRFLHQQTLQGHGMTQRCTGGDHPEEGREARLCRQRHLAGTHAFEDAVIDIRESRREACPMVF